MITKYRTTKYRNDITQAQVVRETDKSVFLQRSGWPGKVQREAKESEWSCYFDTWEEAHKHLLKRAERKREHAINMLAHAEEGLRTVQQMQPPTCSPTSE